MQAQAIVSAFIGKTEYDVVDPNDKILMGQATAYQAAYMLTNKDTIFEQMSIFQISQNGQLVTFRNNDNWSPYLSGLAYLTLRNLSFRRARSIKTGALNYGYERTEWRKD